VDVPRRRADHPVTAYEALTGLRRLGALLRDQSSPARPSFRTRLRSRVVGQSMVRR
jgi:hypothetical protein